MLVTDELLDMVKEQTKLYSGQSTGSSINVTAKDIEKFIVLTSGWDLFGCHPLDRIGKLT